MANSYFQFKQFAVNQEKTAMKVCTDSCIFGAYVSLKEKDKTGNETNTLDLGAGTGVLSLMMAQKLKGNIDAVEIDEDAYRQAEENFENSAWKTRLSAMHADITRLESSKKYDLIVSNPPFFSGSLKSNNEKKNIAKHTTRLSYQELIAAISQNLIEKGRFYILLPFKEFEVFKKIATANELALIRKTDIRPTVSSQCFRSIGVFTNNTVGEISAELLTIKKNDNEYTDEFIELLKDYYLYL